VTQELENGLPCAIDAERTILGAMLLDNSFWDEIHRSLRMDDFSLDSHRRIALRMLQLRKANTAVDIVTLAHALNAKGEIEAIGGVAYLASLTEGLPLRPVISDYIRIVKDKSLLRKLLALSSNVGTRAGEQQETGMQILGDVEKQLGELAAPFTSTKDTHVTTFIVDTFDELKREYHDRLTRRIPSGCAWYDAKTGGGYRHGRIALVAARPNVGKTPWGIMSAVHNLKAGRKVVFFALEQERDEILRAMVPYVVDVANFNVTNPATQTPAQYQLIQSAAETIADWDLHVVDGDVDRDQLVYQIKRHTKNGEECLFVLDHFGLISGGDRKDIRNRYNENSGTLRKTIKHTNSALLILCQLRKVSREFADKPPVDQDIKESGNMFEDAFSCMIIHRGRDRDTGKMSRDSLLDLCKLRSGGSTGSTTGHFNTRMLCFEAEPEAEEDYYA
jgi:replicative DNA helicase